MVGRVEGLRYSNVTTSGKGMSPCFHVLLPPPQGDPVYRGGPGVYLRRHPQAGRQLRQEHQVLLGFTILFFPHNIGNSKIWLSQAIYITGH